MIESKMMVMVASLERNLEDERKVVFEAVYSQNAVPVGLAYPSMPANYIYKLNQQSLNDADYLVLLLGNEYGGLTEKGISYLHAIYVAAGALRKPIVSLVYQGQSNSKLDSFDQKRLAGFLTTIKLGTVYYWKDDDSLRDVTERALEDVFESSPSAGWIKADIEPIRPAVSPSKPTIDLGKSTSSQKSDVNLKKIDQLTKKIKQLESRVVSLNSKTDTQEVSFEQETDAWKVTYHCNAFREGRLKQFNDTVDLDLYDVFRWLSAALLSPVSESRLRAIVSSRLHPLVLKNVQSSWAGCHAVSDLKVDHKAFDELKMRFRALNVIDFDAQGRWIFTQGGEQLALQKDFTA